MDRVVLATAIVSTAVLFTAQAADPVNIPKLTALVLCAIAVVGGCAVRAIRTRVLQLPWGLPAVAGLVLLAAFGVAALSAPVFGNAVLGAYGRNSGLLAYSSALVLFLVGLRVLDRPGTRVVLYALILAGWFTAGYGLLQYVGVDSVAWNNPFNPIIASLGNPNFAAAYVAICAPAAAWGALSSRCTLPWRLLSGGIAVLCLLAALLSDAAQGPLAAAPGLAVLALAWLLDREAAVRRVGLAALGLLTALGTALLVAGLAGAGPAAAVFRDAGSRARGHYWEGALTMWRDHPVLGVGLDAYGGFWRTARSIEGTRALGGDDFSDAAHSVPLHLLATGGLVLALAYLLFVGVVAFALVQGLRQLRGEERLLLGALGGCWAAYQVQSLVSIDQVPLIVTQYVLGAAVVVAAGHSRLREVRLPGALPPPEPPQGGSPRKRRAMSLEPRRRVLTRLDQVALAVVGLVLLGLGWQALVPLRASAAVLDADAALAAQDLRAAQQGYEHAIDLVGSTVYWQRLGALHASAMSHTLATDAYRGALDADPHDPNAARNAARSAEDAGDLEPARELHARALELDPRGPTTVLAAATFELRHEGAARAEALLEDLLTVLPERADAWAALGDARAALGNSGGAREAYQRALQLQPDEPTATA
ncbi:MAG: hypothetical protein JWM62_1894, partial [Frankiales bacterium]|nr:hypothetical protein [Frankiales bacterium]